jgi:hypothetical protein
LARLLTNIALILSAGIFLSIFHIVDETNTARIMLVIQILSLASLTLLFIFSNRNISLSIFQWIFLIIALGTPLLYLIPLPLELWEKLPGRQLYIEIAHWISNSPELEDISKTASLIPFRTELSLLHLLPAFAIFFIMLMLPIYRSKILVYVLFFIAITETGYAYFQYLNDTRLLAEQSQEVLYGTGSYLKSENFAAFLGMVTPLAMGTFVYHLKAEHMFSHKNGRSPIFILSLLYLTLILILVIGILTSQSATGIFLGIIGILLSSIIFIIPAGLIRKAVTTFFFLLAILGFLVIVDIDSLWKLFTAPDSVDSDLWKAYSNTLRGIYDFFPIGSGPGTFPEVYKAYQSTDQLQYSTHAQNDYFELVFEMGAAGLLIIILYFILYSNNWKRLNETKKGQFFYIQTGAGVGILVFLLHGFISYNFHIPANAITFAFLMGLFLHQPEFKRVITHNWFTEAKAHHEVLVYENDAEDGEDKKEDENKEAEEIVITEDDIEEINPSERWKQS